MDREKISLIDKVELIKDRKKQAYGFSVFTVLVLIILIVGAIRPSVLTIVRINSEIKEKQQTLATLNNKINALNSLAQQYNEFKDTADDLALVYPANGDFSLFLANIENISETYGFELRSIGFGNERRREDTQYETLEPISVTLSVAGQKSNLIPFLQRIEEMPMYPVVNSISYSVDEDDDGNTSYSLSIHIYEVGEDNFYEDN